VGRRDDLVDVEDRGVVRERFGLVDVQRGALHDAVADGLGEGVLLDDPAAGAVDDVAVLELGELFLADEALGVGGQRRVDGRDVGRRERVVEILVELRAELFGALRGDVGVERDDVHPQRVAFLGDLLADAAEADDAQRLPVELRAEIVALGPLAVLEAAVGLRDRARRGEDHADGVLGGRTDVRIRRVGDDDAVVGCRVDVDVVDADAGASDDDHVLGRVEHSLVHVGAGADDQRVGVRHGLEECVALHVVGRLHLVARLAERLDTLVRDRVGDEYLHTPGKPWGAVNGCYVAVEWVREIGPNRLLVAGACVWVGSARPPTVTSVAPPGLAWSRPRSRASTAGRSTAT